ncbi:hypothetical protein ElyMa_001200200 [Elysia marginata]|uniref:Uncharacterized protein n=1 Tax=Elysia marginata TaxID=1093978 RepID=A0AAV4I7B5_9GAST|nr:hypothetical protein ElyMa_001200200 [Elysia marginata]
MSTTITTTTTPTTTTPTTNTTYYHTNDNHPASLCEASNRGRQIAPACQLGLTAGHSLGPNTNRKSAGTATEHDTPIKQLHPPLERSNCPPRRRRFFF